MHNSMRTQLPSSARSFSPLFRLSYLCYAFLFSSTAAVDPRRCVVLLPFGYCRVRNEPKTPSREYRSSSSLVERRWISQRIILFSSLCVSYCNLEERKGKKNNNKQNRERFRTSKSHPTLQIGLVAQLLLVIVRFSNFCYSFAVVFFLLMAGNFLFLEGNMYKIWQECPQKEKKNDNSISVGS